VPGWHAWRRAPQVPEPRKNKAVGFIVISIFRERLSTGNQQKGDRVYTPVSLPDTLCKRLCTLGKMRLASNALNTCFHCHSAVWMENCCVPNYRGRMNQPQGRAGESRLPWRREDRSPSSYSVFLNTGAVGLRHSFHRIVDTRPSLDQGQGANPVTKESYRGTSMGACITG
jgi:hypothetical protein